MKAKGIKPRHRSPAPPPLTALPCNLMVLSAVMLLMSRVGMTFTPLAPPVTFVEAWGGVRSLHASLPFTLPPPPEPPPSLSPVPSPDPASSIDGEGDEEPNGSVNQLKCLAPAELDELLCCQFIAGSSVPTNDPLLHTWTDLSTHVSDSWWKSLVCCLCRWPTTSFGPLGLLAGLDDDLIAIVDTGASLCVTPFRDDFETYSPETGRVLKGLTQGVTIAGTGVVRWNIEVDGKVVELKLRALHVPTSEVRLLSPQQLKKEHQPLIPKIEIEADSVMIHFAEGALSCPCNESNLPFVQLSTVKRKEADVQALNACVMAEANQNLTVSQKALLKWHCRLGHLGFRDVQRIMKSGALGHDPVIKAASNTDLNKTPLVCGSCAYAKAKRRPTRKKTDRSSSSPTDQDKLLSKEVLIPGQKVSMDHFIVSTPGRLFSSRGSEPTSKMYKGGVIFKDHASNFVFAEPVVNFTAGEAIRAKRAFEREMHSMGVTVLNYHTDNGVFTASQFQDELAGMEQGMTLSGVGAHHQNAVAEREIGILFNLARAQMLHAKLRWPKAVSATLWPMVLKHTQHLVNHIPGRNNVCPLDLILKSTVPREPLRNLHVWGAPAYVLDPKLQDGHKIPKWEPRSRQGLHLGWSPLHASTVPLILNLSTGHISPQFHVVFDDWFTTVSTADKSPLDDIENEVWSQLFNDHRFQAHFDDDDPMDLDDEWLSELERLEKHQRAVAKVQSRLPAQLDQPPADAPPPAPLTQLPPLPTDPPLAPPLPMEQGPPVPPVPLNPPRAPVPPPPMDPGQQREQPTAPTPAKPKRKAPALDPVTPPKGPRPRPPPGRFKGMCAAMIALIGNHNLTLMADTVRGSPAGFLAMNSYNAVTDTLDEVDYFSYRAITAPKTKGKKGFDPDFPTYAQAMSSPEAHEWQAAMDEEVKVLIGMNTWTLVPRSEATRLGKKVIKSTWAFRQKRSPSGEATKKKARFCVRGDLQSKFEEFESYSPVVQWSTVRLMLILSIVHGLETRQVDYVNAFAQADLEKDVFIEIPQGFEHSNEVDCVLKLNKSLYGMSDAPLMFFELLKKNLKSIGFKQIEHIDPCLFVHKHAICLTYVDDCLWFGKDGAALDRLIKEMQGKMDLKVESRDVSAFLGIQFTRHGDTIELKQLGLIDKIIEATGLQDCNPKSTPADAKTLGKDKHGAPFSEQWNCASVVGMLLYLSGNSRPDIAFAVNQAARFTHDPKASHATAVKRIVKCLKGTRDRGLIFKPSTDWKVDCWVDADFCGLWGSEDPEDPIVSKSRTGYVITLAGCPLTWRSTLQQETSLSTMMAEYVALSTAMREMLPLKRLVKTIAKVVTGDENVKLTTLSDVFEDNNGALTVATLPRITPQSKFFAVNLHFFKEHVKTDSNPAGEIHIQKIETTKQLADIMTKGLVEDKFVPLRDRLMGWDLNSSPASESNVHSRGSVENVSPKMSPARDLNSNNEPLRLNNSNPTTRNPSQKKNRS